MNKFFVSFGKITSYLLLIVGIVCFYTFAQDVYNYISGITLVTIYLEMIYRNNETKPQ